MEVESAFDRFACAIRATPGERRAALLAAHRIAAALDCSFGVPGTGWLAVGSYGKDTAVRPVWDVDILYPLPAAYDHGDSEPHAILASLSGRLRRRLPDASIRHDVVVLQVTAGGPTVELIPALAGPDGTYLVPSSHRAWSAFEPTADRTDLDRSDRATLGRTRDLIRLVKARQGRAEAGLSSLVIELECVAFHEVPGNAVLPLDQAVAAFFRHLADRAGGSRRIPGTDELKTYGDHWLPAVAMAHGQATEAIRLRKEGHDDDAGRRWRALFGPRFT